MIKVCKKCGNEKPMSEYNKNPKTKDGYYGACKACCADYLKEYWENNKDKLSKKAKEYRLAHPLPRKTASVNCDTCGKVIRKRTCNVKDVNYCSDKCAHQREARIKDDSKNCTYCGNFFHGTKKRKYCSSECAGMARRDVDAKWRDPDYIRLYQKTYQREWYKENREKVLEQAKERHQKNPTLRQSHLARYRATRANLPNFFTHDDWITCLEHWGYTCAVCGRPQGLFHTLAADHWIPLSNPDCIGTVPHNILPLCHGVEGCNNSKSNSDGETWLIAKLGKTKAKRKLDEITEYFKQAKALYPDVEFRLIEH